MWVSVSVVECMCMYVCGCVCVNVCALVNTYLTVKVS